MALAMEFSPDGSQTCKKPTPAINHFSHRHPLAPYTPHEDDFAVCSGCELDILGGSPAYICTKPNCAFLLHAMCVDLPRRIRHRAHPNHPLGLLPNPRYSDGEFTCDACGNSGHGFTYHSEACMFDIHVGCASLPEMEESPDHEHPLILQCGVSGEMDGLDFVCYVCGEGVGKGRWRYGCLWCKCVGHLECVGNP